MDTQPREAGSTLASDVIFTLLPIVVIIVALTHYRGASSIFASPEFSFAAAVLFGQTIVKFIRISRPDDAVVGMIGFLQSLLIVGGLCPTLIVLFILLGDDINRVEPSLLLKVSQMVLLVISIAGYFLFGLLAADASIARDLDRQDAGMIKAPTHARMTQPKR